MSPAISSTTQSRVSVPSTTLSLRTDEIRRWGEAEADAGKVQACALLSELWKLLLLLAETATYR